MRAVAAGSLSILALANACAPMITHGPEVHPGFSGGISMSTGRGPTYENGDDPGPFYWGAAAASAAYGIRPSSSARPAARFGVQAPTEGAVAIDVFLQAPRKWVRPVSAGAGVLAEFSDGRQMPYLQAGVRNGEGYGANIAVGHYWNRNRNTGYTLHESAQVNWLNLEAPVSRFATFFLHAGYASGHVRKKMDRSPEPYVDENRWVKLGGVTVEFHRPVVSRMQAVTR